MVAKVKPKDGPNSLVNSNLGGNLGPKAGVFDRRDLLLRVTVHVHVQHQAAEGRPQVKGQVLIGHTAQDQIHVQLTRDLVDGQVLAVQTHPGKEVQLAPVRQNSFCRIPYLFNRIVNTVSHV